MFSKRRVNYILFVYHQLHTWIMTYNSKHLSTNGIWKKLCNFYELWSPIQKGIGLCGNTNRKSQMLFNIALEAPLSISRLYLPFYSSGHVLDPCLYPQQKKYVEGYIVFIFPSIYPSIRWYGHASVRMLTFCVKVLCESFSFCIYCMRTKLVKVTD